MSVFEVLVACATSQGCHQVIESKEHKPAAQLSGALWCQYIIQSHYRQPGFQQRSNEKDAIVHEEAHVSALKLKCMVLYTASSMPHV
jgi:hypothetical protein